MKKIIQKFKLAVKTVLCWTYYRKDKIKDNRVFVMTYDNAYSCNEKYIVEEMIRRKLPVEIIWVCPSKGKRGYFPPNVRTLRRGSLAMYRAQITSKIWLDNALNCVWYYLPKRKGQIYLNTWHGSLGIKKLSGNKHWIERARSCKKVTDYCITNSKFEEDVFRNTFWPKTPFLKFGHARNDILFDKEKASAIRMKVAKQLNLDSGKKWILYGPTFRDSGNTDCFDLDFVKIKEVLEERFSGEWQILVRMHFKNRKVSNTFTYNEWLKDASKYADMQELLAVVDAGITDYSSWAYDYVLTRRPLFLYVPDLDQYDQERGFYYPLEETPFNIAKTNDILMYNIMNFDNEIYTEKVNSFLEEKGCYEDGHAAAKIVDMLEREIFNFKKE